MKFSFPGTFLFLIAGFVSTGCRHDVAPNPVQRTDTVVAKPPTVLSKIKVQHAAATNSINQAFALQYDTVNKKMNVYLDDTTTSNPFDLLAYTYEFNKGGYLVTSKALDANHNLKTDYTITRNASNQIQKIIDFDAYKINGVSKNDTVFYSYKVAGNKIFIQDSTRIKGNTIPAGFSTYKTTYTLQTQPLSAQYFSAKTLQNTTRYEYNDVPGLITNIFNDQDTTDLTYNSTAADRTWQQLHQTFLGKDYYVLETAHPANRAGYHFLDVLVETKFKTTYNPLFTKPLQKLYRYGFPVNTRTYKTQKINVTTTYTADKKPASIALLPDGGSPFYYSFKYE